MSQWVIATMFDFKFNESYFTGFSLQVAVRYCANPSSQP